MVYLQTVLPVVSPETVSLNVLLVVYLQTVLPVVSPKTVSLNVLPVVYLQTVLPVVSPQTFILRCFSIVLSPRWLSVASPPNCSSNSFIPQAVICSLYPPDGYLQLYPQIALPSVLSPRWLSVAYSYFTPLFYLSGSLLRSTSPHSPMNVIYPF